MAAVLQHQPESTYTFTSQPRAVPQRKKYREITGAQNEKRSQQGNIMYDRRIIRGSTYASNVIPTTAQPDPIELQRQQAAKRRQMAKKQAKLAMRVRSPDAVEGRKHVEVQSELYLEELSDRVEEADIECQTDAFLDRPPSPLFVPAKSGVDVATQILEGELFDFDVEVKPILEVLVGKTVEQSLLEVMEEEELSTLRQQQRQFEELRNVELAEQQRLEEQDRRFREEKERRMRQEQDRQNKDKETGNKIAAHAFAHGYLSDLLPAVFGSLSDYGYFYDPVERDVEQNFMPWLMDEMDERLNRNELSRVLLDTLIRQVTQQRQEDYERLEEMLNAPPQQPSTEEDAAAQASLSEPPTVVIEGSTPVPPAGEADVGKLTEEGAESREGDQSEEAQPAADDADDNE